MVQTRMAEFGSAPLLDPAQKPPGMPPKGLLGPPWRVPRTSGLANSLLCATYVRPGVALTFHLWSCAFSPHAKRVQAFSTGSKYCTGVMCRWAVAPQGKTLRVAGFAGQGLILPPGIMVSQTGGKASFLQLAAGF